MNELNRRSVRSRRVELYLLRVRNCAGAQEMIFSTGLRGSDVSADPEDRLRRIAGGDPMVQQALHPTAVSPKDRS
jgi:hypothetical protein